MLFADSPELLYNVIANLDLRLRIKWLTGGSGPEFGEKPNVRKLELMARIYFWAPSRRRRRSSARYRQRQDRAGGEVMGIEMSGKRAHRVEQVLVELLAGAGNDAFEFVAGLEANDFRRHACATALVLPGHRRVAAISVELGFGFGDHMPAVIGDLSVQ